MTKSELRKEFLDRRQALSSAELETASARITANLFDNFDLAGARFLHCFIPIKHFAEVDTRPIFQWLWSEYPQIQTVVPRVNHETEELENLRYGIDIPLVENKWRIGEPSHNEHVEPTDIDVVLVPLLCFDLNGHRVGYGRGYYDRFLRRCRADCEKIGLSFFPPIERIDDAHEGDIRLNACVTPDQLYTF